MFYLILSISFLLPLACIWIAAYRPEDIENGPNYGFDAHNV